MPNNTNAEEQAELVNTYLVGYTITGAVLNMDGRFFGLRLTKGDITITAWVDRDAEGNAAGHLDIEPFPPAATE